MGYYFPRTPQKLSDDALYAMITIKLCVEQLVKYFIVLKKIGLSLLEFCRTLFIGLWYTARPFQRCIIHNNYFPTVEVLAI